MKQNGDLLLYKPFSAASVTRKLFIPSKQGDLCLVGHLGLSPVIPLLQKKFSGGGCWCLWMLTWYLHLGLTVSWETVFETLFVTVVRGGSGLEEVKY